MKAFKIKTEQELFWLDVAESLAGGDTKALAKQAGITAANFKRYLEGSDTMIRVLERAAGNLQAAFIIGDKEDSPILQFSGDSRHIMRSVAVLEKHIGHTLSTYTVQKLVESSGENISAVYFYQLVTGARVGSVKNLLKIANALGVRFVVCGHDGLTLISAGSESLVLSDMTEAALRKKPQQKLLPMLASLGYGLLDFNTNTQELQVL